MLQRWNVNNSRSACFHMHIMITLPIFKQAQFYAERFTLGLRRGASPLVLGIAEGDVPQIAVFLAVFVAAKDVNSGVPVRVDDHKTFILLFGRFGRTGGFFSGVAVPIGSVVSPNATSVTSGVCVATEVQPTIENSKKITTSIAKICLIRYSSSRSRVRTMRGWEALNFLRINSHLMEILFSYV